MTIKQTISLLISLCAFVGTFYAVGKFMLLLSTPTKVQRQWVWLANLLDNKSLLETAFPYVTLDLAYISAFIVQHSFMKSNLWKQVLSSVGLDIAERSIYCLASSYVLWYLVKNWQTIPTIALWHVDVSDSPALWWTFVLVHGLAWTIIYGGSIIMDLPEIIGVKQVYYDMKNFLSPSYYKSNDLRNLYEHVRHPSFVGFLMVLWITNIMTLDRFLLAFMLSAYMYIAWSTTDIDVAYQRYQLKRKRDELAR